MNNKYKILIIEDEINIRKIISTLLCANQFKVLCADSVKSGLMIYNSYMPDVVILDLGLPDCDGITFLKEIRKEFLTPVLVLSARTDEKDKVEAFDMGANDYVTKPFGSEELVARIKCLIRNSRPRPAESKFPGGEFKMNDVMINFDTRKFYYKNENIKLTQTEFNIISLLSEHCGKVLTYQTIIKEIWGINDLGSIKRLQVNMANIRKKLSINPGDDNFIVNELGVGYRMVDKS